MSTLFRDLKRLASQAWLETQHRPLCPDEKRDLRDALSDLDDIYQDDAVTWSKQEKAA